MIATCSALRVFERIILVVPAIGRMAATYAVGLQLEDAYLKPELGLIRGLTAAEKERIVNLPYEKRSTAKAYVRPGDKDSLRIFRKTAAGAENGDGAYEVCWDRQQRAAFIATHELSGAVDFDDAQHLQVRREGGREACRVVVSSRLKGCASRVPTAPPPLTWYSSVTVMLQGGAAFADSLDRLSSVVAEKLPHGAHAASPCVIRVTSEEGGFKNVKAVLHLKALVEPRAYSSAAAAQGLDVGLVEQLLQLHAGGWVLPGGAADVHTHQWKRDHPPHPPCHVPSFVLHLHAGAMRFHTRHAVPLMLNIVPPLPLPHAGAMRFHAALPSLHSNVASVGPFSEAQRSAAFLPLEGIDSKHGYTWMACREAALLFAVPDDPAQPLNSLSSEQVGMGKEGVPSGWRRGLVCGCNPGELQSQPSCMAII